jgi:GNAT superfamily N-acetyltransferase
VSEQTSAVGAPGAGPRSARPTVREARFPDDALDVSRLVGAYLRQTELEKAARGLAEPLDGGRLPGRYQSEVDDPARAFSGAAVLLASLPVGPVGLVVLTTDPHGSGEIKRFWVDPAARGVGAGRLLLDAVADRVDGPLRLSVWRWRDDAVRSYRRAGFVEVPSWEAREQLVCLERPARGAQGRTL